MKIIFFILISLIIASAETLAHGPTRQKVVEKIIIQAPIEKVWHAVRDFQNMSWHPAVASSTGEGGSAVGATRTLTLKKGGSITENLEKYLPSEYKYFYRIVEVSTAVLPINNYSAWFMLKQTAEGNTEVIWKGAFYRGYMNNNPPADLNDKAAIAAVRGLYISGLNQLKKLLEE